MFHKSFYSYRKKIIFSFFGLFYYCIAIAQTPNNGTLTNGAQYSTDVPRVISSNTYSVSLDGISGKIIPTNEIVLGENGAISIWFKKTDINGKGVATTSTDGVAYINVQSATQITVCLKTTSGNGYSYTAIVPFTMTSNTWYHLVLNRIAWVNHIYVNNTEVNVAISAIS